MPMNRILILDFLRRIILFFNIIADKKKITMLYGWNIWREHIKITDRMREIKKERTK